MKWSEHIDSQYFFFSFCSVSLDRHTANKNIKLNVILGDFPGRTQITTEILSLKPKLA